MPRHLSAVGHDDLQQDTHPLLNQIPVVAFGVDGAIQQGKVGAAVFTSRPSR
jgi:hypothetical protein